MNLEILKPLSLLYVEDEPLIRQNAVEYLSRYCKCVYEAKDGIEGYTLYTQHKPDLIITDINMPRLDGLALASQIREHDLKTPILIATAHTNQEYLLKALELQLIKYIIKPLNAEKLQEALHMVAKKIESTESSRIQLDAHLMYDLLNQTLWRKQETIKLTHNEQLFFDFLVQHRQRAITYQEIESLIWTYEGMTKDALRSLVRGLRKKLSPDKNKVFIENISGVGYRLKIDTSCE